MEGDCYIERKRRKGFKELKEEEGGIIRVDREQDVTICRVDRTCR